MLLPCRVKESHRPALQALQVNQSDVELDTEPSSRPQVTSGSLLTRVLAAAVGEGQRVFGVDLSLTEAARHLLLLLLLLSTVNWHLAELASEAGRTVALVP